MLTTCSFDIYITNDHENNMTSYPQESPCSRDSDDLGTQDDNKLSPCIFQCRLESIDNIEMCISCGRTRDEIVNWREFDQAQKDIVFKLSNERMLKKLGKI